MIVHNCLSQGKARSLGDGIFSFFLSLSLLNQNGEILSAFLKASLKAEVAHMQFRYCFPRFQDWSNQTSASHRKTMIHP